MSLSSHKKVCWIFGLTLLLFGSVMNTLASAQEAAPRLKVLTYNRGTGTDGEFDLERLAKTINDLKPDIAAFQEVDNNTKRSPDTGQAGQLGKLTGLKHVFGKAMYFSSGQYGVAILSRFPLDQVKNYPLPYDFGQEPRTVLSVRGQPKNGLPDFVFADTHLCHNNAETCLQQTQQLNAVLQSADGLNALPDSSPIKVLLEKCWTDAISPKSRIDHVLYLQKDLWKVLEITIVDDKVLASDHRPVLAVLEWHGNQEKKREFKHPGISNTQQELESIRYRANSDDDSLVKQGWNQLLKSKLSSLSYSPSPHVRPVVVGSRSGPDERDLHNDAVAAYAHALQWVITEDKRHSAKAIEILNAWSAVLEDIVPQKGSPKVQDHLEAAWYGPLFMSAAEIIRHYNNGAAGWSQTDIHQFEKLVAVFKKEALQWSGSASCPNQGISVAFHRMALGVYTDDQSLYQSGLNLFVNDILRTDDPVRIAILPSGEVWEINRKQGGDCGHASYNIEGILNLSEMAWIQGDDIYSLKIDGEKVPRILKGVEYMARCIVAGPVQTTKEGLVGCTRLRPVSYEAALNHYTNRLQNYTLPFTEKLLREKIRPSDGVGGKFLPWDTLTHGDISKPVKQ